MSDDREQKPYVLCTCCREKTYIGVAIFLTVVGLAAAGVSVFLPPYINSALDQALTDQVTFTADDQANGERAFRVWADPTDPDAVALYYHVYVWNVTNPEAVLHGAKPELTEVGPYVYRDMQARFNVSFEQDEELRHVMKYRQYEYYLFQRDMTDASLNPDTDMVYSPNIPFQVLVPRGFVLDGIIHVMDGFYEKKTDFYRLWGERMRSVSEVLFGYVDPEMAAASKLFGPSVVPPVYPGIVGNDTSLDAAATDISGTHKFFTVYTGEAPNQQLLRQYKSWQDMDYLTAAFNPAGGAVQPMWNAPSANVVGGTDGTQFRRNLQNGMSVDVFVNELYRSAFLINAPATDDFYCQTLDIKGINLYRFTMGPTILQNSTLNPANSAYDMYGASGLANLTVPRSANLFVSKPHFLDGSSALLDALSGVTPPVRTKHDTFVDVEPLTGTVMNAAKRLQANVYLLPYNHSTLTGVERWLPNVAQVMLPVFWVEQVGVIPDHLASEFVGSVYFAQSLSLYLQWVGFIGGSVLVLVAFVMMLAKASYFPPNDTRSIQDNNGQAPYTGMGAEDEQQHIATRPEYDN